MEISVEKDQVDNAKDKPRETALRPHAAAEPAVMKRPALMPAQSEKDAKKDGEHGEKPGKKKAIVDWMKKNWKMWAIPLGLVVAVFLIHWLWKEFTTEDTDDAYITSHVHIISARIAGTVQVVAVNDNQMMKKGDLLIKLDPTDYEVAEHIAKANAINAHNTLARWREHEFLHPNEEIQKSADIAAALNADSNLQQADLNLKYTNIVAPEDGKIGNKTIETGMQIQAGQALMSIVEPIPWIVANFKEGQVAHMRNGQHVDIEVDSVPDHKFEGIVDSVSPGSGTQFALLPTDNATGNFTKIVQRIPVKITFTPESLKGYESRLAPGMSTEVTVKTR